MLIAMICLMLVGTAIAVVPLFVTVLKTVSASDATVASQATEAASDKDSVKHAA